MEDGSSSEERKPLVEALPPLRIGQLYQYIPGPSLRTLIIYGSRHSGNSNMREIRRKSILIVLGADRNSYRVASSGFEGWIQLSKELLSDQSVFKPLDSYRAYEDWSGNNYFFLNGRIMIGSHAVFFIACVVVMVLCSALTLYYIIREDFHSPVILPLLPFFFVYTFSTWIATALIEPGILPHNAVQKQARLPAGASTIAGDPLSWKYCPTCNIFRPPRSKHCRYCQNCVLEFDHHCPYTGSCIGMRNRRSFLQFLFSFFVYAFLCFVASLSIVVNKVYEAHERRKLGMTSYMLASPNEDQQLIRLLLGIFLALLWASLIIMLSPFCWYHLRITSIGQTTNEYQREVYASIPNPFDRGTTSNWLAICCERIPPSELQDMHRVCTAQDCLQSNCVGISLEALLGSQRHSSASYNT